MNIYRVLLPCTRLAEILTHATINNRYISHRMGNTLKTEFKNCCTNYCAQKNKEVDVNYEHDEEKFETGLRSFNMRKTQKLDAGSDIQFRKPESMYYELNNNRNIQSFEQDRVKYLEQIVSRAPVLLMTVLNSTILQKGAVIKIDAQGAVNSLRGKKDGITYFGCKKKSKPETGKQEEIEVLNDVVIHNKEDDVNNRHRGQHFQIEFSPQNNNYKIKDLGIGFGAFVKIDHPLLLRDNNLLSMGSSFLIINFSEEYKESLVYSQSYDPDDTRGAKRTPKHTAYNDVVLVNSHTINDDRIIKRAGFNTSITPDITIKIFGGPNYGEVYQFNPMISQVIKIGRMADCEIKIDDNLLSKYQCTLKYIPSSGWTLFDGYNGKPSTNSNWLYLNDDFEIYHNMILKANHTLFQLSLVNPQ